MSTVCHEVRRGAYFDSIVLMRLQVALAALPGIEDCGVMMATRENLAQLERGGLLPEPPPKASPEDLVLTLRAQDAAAGEAALAKTDDLLGELLAHRGEAGGAYRPKSLGAAVKQLPEARWVLVSVAGRWAGGVAREALDLGRHVFLYSDNVPVAEEAELKLRAREKGLLVMGPDCGTAVVAGHSLGFANRVRRGAIGLVGASGTGLQAVASHIHRRHGGISHALGTGGRDLSAEVGGTTALQALDLLARDPETRVVVVVSKPPDPGVAARLLAAAQAIGKPVVAMLLGYAPPARRLGAVRFASSFEDAAVLAVTLEAELADARTAELARTEAMQALDAAHGGMYLRGLFSGGTLAYAALLALRTRLAPLATNVGGLPGLAALEDPTVSRGHSVVDLGDDALTVGKLHPMMDPDACRRRLRQEAADPQVGVILIDVILGDGAHADPAGQLAPVIAEIAAGGGPPIIVLLVGTDEDPQPIDEQIERLESAGATVFRDTATAVEHAVGRLVPESAPMAEKPVPLETLDEPFAAINVGVESFYATLRESDAAAVQVDWRPPAGGNEKLLSILEKMRR